MVLDQSPTLDRAFHALAHPARRAILRQLAQGERNLSELAAPLNMTFPAASKHVRVLEGARLVRRRIHGRDHFCQLDVKPLDKVTEWTEQCRKLWEANFARLDALLEELQALDGGTSSTDGPASLQSAPARRARSTTRRKIDHPGRGHKGAP